MIWVTGDATLQRIATGDWVNSKCALHSVPEFMEALREAVGVEEDEEAIIAIAEFMNLVTFAAKAGAEGWWEHGVVMYGGTTTTCTAGSRTGGRGTATPVS